MKSDNPHLTANVATFCIRADAEDIKWQQFRIEQICSILRNIPNKQIGADIGCCNGMATPYYAATGFETMHGYDVSEDSLRELRHKGFTGFNWNADGGICPAEDMTYDVIIAGEIIEHLIDTDNFVQELHRILKPTGYLILTTPNLASWYNRLRLFRGLPPRSYPGVSSIVSNDPLIDRNHIRVNVLSEWSYLLKIYGFNILDIYGSSHLQILQGGWRIKVLKFIDRLACKKPSLAVNFIFVAQKA